MPLMSPVPNSVRFSTFAARRMADKGKDAVGTLTGKLRRFAAGLIDVVDRRFRAAKQFVDASVANQQIVASIADQSVYLR